MIDWEATLFPRTGGGTTLADFLTLIGVHQDAPSITLSERLGEASTFEFSLPTDHPNMTRGNFLVGQRNVNLRRKGTPVFYGRLWVGDLAGWVVRFSASDFSSVFDGWLVDQDFDWHAEDQYTIIDELLDYLQGRTGSDESVSYSPGGGSGVNRDYRICVEDRKTFRNVLDDFAEARDGFDWWVDENRILHTVAFRGSASGITLGGNDWTDISYQIDAQDVISQVYGFGPEADCAEPNVYSAIDSGARSAYGLRQGSTSVDQPDTPLRDSVALEALTSGAIPRFQGTVRISSDLPGARDWDEYVLGDTITLKPTRGPVDDEVTGSWDNFGDDGVLVRIIGKSTLVTRPGLEVITLDFDNRTALT